MATVTFDTIDNTQLQTQGLFGRVQRGFVVSGLTANPTADPAVIFSAQALVQAASGGGYPGRADFVFSGLLIRGFTTDGCYGYAVYETTTYGAPSSYVIENTSYVSAVEGNILPAWLGNANSRKPIEVSYSAAGFGTIKDLVTMRFNRPIRAFSVSGLVYGSPAAGKEDYVGAVNNATWGPPGRTALPVGFWMLMKYRDTVSVYAGYYTYEAIVASRTFEDWSETGILRNSVNGRYPTIDPAQIAACNAASYSYGMIFVGNGIIRVGANPTVSFPSIMGF